MGFAHSWADIYKPRGSADGSHGTTIALHKLSGITNLVRPDLPGQEGRGEVEVLTGTSFAYLHDELAQRGLALAWLVSALGDL